MEYLVLGPLEVHDGDGPLPLAGEKQRALLALLLLNANRVVSRERLIDDLWGENPPDTAVTSVQVYVSRLRKLLPPDTLVTRPPGYLMATDPEDVDLHRFERLLGEGRSALAGGDAERAALRLGEALELWRGPPFAEFVSEPFARVESGRLAELRLAALVDRNEAELALGRHEALIAELESLIAAHPHSERLRGQLMLALYRSGRQADALEAYRQARASLDELGIEPSETLRVLERSILTQDAALDPMRPLVVETPPLPGPLRVQPSFQFVGRERELEQLRALLASVKAGDGGRVVLLAGEAGGGKTRLARELAREAVERGTIVLFGGCDAVVSAPYQPFAEALEFLVRVSDPETLARCIGDGAGDLARLLPGIAAGSPPLPGADPATERRRLHRAVVQLFANASDLRALLLVIDDLQWADTSSLQLFRDVTRAVPETRTLVLATVRDRTEDRRPELAEALAHLSRLDGLVRLRLGGLGSGEVAEFVRLATDANPAEGLAEALLKQTDGTPFLLCELWRALVEAGAVTTSDRGVAVTGSIAKLASPEGVRDVVHHRLSRLARKTRAMLDVAAVAGPRFEPRLLGDDASIAASVDEAIASGMIEEVPGLGLSHRFSHELVRRALYDRLSSVRSAELHLQVGEALERLHAEDTAPVLPDLAHHFAAAAPLGGAERAVRYNIAAAEAAASAFALAEAAENLATALELGIPDELTRGRVELDLARALWLTGQHERAGELLDDALESAREAGDERTEWYVRLERLGLHRTRGADELEPLARQAAEVFERLGDDLGLARARRRIALAASDRCAFGEAARESEVALEHAIAAGDLQEETRIVDALCSALLYGPAPVSVGVARCAELLSRANGRPMMEALILTAAAGLEAMAGRFDSARVMSERAESIFVQLEVPVFVAALSAIRGPIELAAGDAEAAEAVLRRAIAFLADRGGEHDAIAYRSALLSFALLAQGKHDEAEEALAMSPPSNLISRITYGIAAGRVRDDVDAARGAVELVCGTEALNLHADARAALGELLAAQGSDDASQELELALALYRQKENEPAARVLSEE